MSRAFFSLYFSLVLSIVFLGWFADQLWKSVNPEPDLSHTEIAFLETLQVIDQNQISEIIDQLDKLDSNFKISLVDIEDFANSSLSLKISKGEIVSLFQRKGTQIIYMRLGDSNKVISISIKYSDENADQLYFVILIFFYLLMALAIYLWIWPLTRDIKKLKFQTQIIGKDGVLEKIHIGSQSVVADLAESFNQMSVRIRALITSHKDMTSAVSHELRTPLARMRFSLELAQNCERPEDIASQLKSLKMDVEEMDALISGLLRYAGYEHYSQKLDFQPGDLKSLVENIIESINATANIDFEFKYSGLDKNIVCEWKLIEHCIRNLIQNALKYGNSKIRITALLEISNEDSECKVVVEDDGQGIDESSRERVLDPFVRLSGTNKKSGFGLGLAIVKRIMTWHKGKITIDDSDLGGAKVTISWPNDSIPNESDMRPN